MGGEEVGKVGTMGRASVVRSKDLRYVYTRAGKVGTMGRVSVVRSKDLRCV